MSDDIFKDFEGPLRDILADVFARGYEAGAVAMRENILKAAGAPLPSLGAVASPHTQAGTGVIKEGQGTFVGRATVRVHPDATSVNHQTERARAPHGAVSTAVELILKETPGLPMRDIMHRVVELDARISPSSVGTELRRYDTDRYHQDGDGNWFLGGTPPKEEEEPDDEPDSSFMSLDEGR